MDKHGANMRTVLGWFAAPVFPSDEEKTRRAALLNATIIMALGAFGFLIPTLIIEGSTRASVLKLDVVVFSVIVLLYLLLKRGLIRLAAYAVIILPYIWITWINVYQGTVRTPATSMYMFVVILAGLLFSWPGTLLSVAGVSLGVFGVVWSQLAGLLPPPDHTIGLGSWAAYTCLFGATGALTQSAYQNLQRLLNHSRHTEQELRMLLRAVEQSPAAIVITTLQGEIEYVNQRFSQMTGYSPAEVIGRNPRLLKSGNTLPEVYQQMWAHLSAGREWQGEFANRRKDGSILYESVQVSPITDPNGKITHYLSVAEDATVRKQTQEALQRANLELEDAMRLKDAFLASVSHELRTPLTGILGLSEALQMDIFGNLNERQRQMAAGIAASGQRLLEVINDILDVSKLGAGRLALQPGVCALEEICQASLNLIQSQADARHQQVSLALDPRTIQVWADPRRLRQALVQLLDNAVKYSPERACLGIEARLLAGQAVEITVWDTGIGIAEEHLERLFAPFMQVDSRLARTQNGTGLGLALAYGLVKLHGGMLTPRSVVGQGSRFTITLPAAPADAAPGAPA
ncbi:MAG: ATP-binding protein [Chloroflexota bacterium]